MDGPSGEDRGPNPGVRAERSSGLHSRHCRYPRPCSLDLGRCRPPATGQSRHQLMMCSHPLYEGGSMHVRMHV